MAFLSKVGSILRQTANKQIGNECSAARPSLFQALRFMSSSKLFVGGISYQTDDMSLREAFGKYGEVIEARVILDRETGRSRGFGFVTYTSTEEASSAIQALDGQDLHGRRVRVNYANDRPRGNFGGGYGAGGGGYGAGGGGYGGGYNNNNYGGSYGVSSGNYGGGNFAAGGEGSVGNVGYAAGNEFSGSSEAYGSDNVGGSNLGSYGNAGMEPSGGDNEFGDREGDNLDASAGDFDQDKDDDDTGDFAKRA